MNRETLLALAGGFGAGFLAGLFGIGGGVLLVPVLVLLLHRPQHVAHATSLLAIVIPAAVGATRFAFDGAVAWLGAATVAVGAVAGVQGGAWLMPRVRERRLRWLFAGLLAVMAVRLLVFGSSEPAGGGAVVDVAWSSLAAHLVLGLVTGVVSALLGIGGGAIIVPALVILFGYGQHLAEGTSLAIILPTAALGAVTHARRGYTDWRAGLQLGIGGMIGALLGAELALALPAPVLSRAFAVLLAVVTVLLVREARSESEDDEQRPDAEGDAADRVSVRPLSPELTDAWLGFLDREAFPDGHPWAGSYCAYDTFPGPADEFDPSDAARNRARMQRLAEVGLVRGWVAFDRGRAVGWCHATSRVELPHLKVPAPLPARTQRTAVVACLVVARDGPGRGVAHRLLDAAVDAFERQGFNTVEAYPPRSDDSPERLYRGDLVFYEDAGFDVVVELDDHYVVHRPLGDSD
ncbi:MAG: GNAT family N-acetyltransferase [Actinobacteria bacterium]|nr:GNAT family N-acetyltransferase [Actinomycetota bacterium]